MEHFKCLHKVRDLVRDQLASLGAQSDQAWRESILLVEDHYIGRRFFWNDYRATWLIEEDTIEFHLPDGETYATVSLSEQASDLWEAPQRKAA